TPAPDGVPFVAFSLVSRGPSETRVAVLARPTDQQRFTVDEGEQTRILRLSNPFLQCVQQPTDGDARQSPAKGAGRRQACWATSGRGPVAPATRPTMRSVMQRRPKQNGDNDPRLVLHILLLKIIANFTE